MRYLSGLCLMALLLGTGCQQPPKAPAPPPDSSKQESKAIVKYGVLVVSGPIDSIPLEDYAPDSLLKVPETQVPKARFPR